MQTLFHFLQTVVETTAGGIHTETQPLLENIAQAHHRRAAIDPNNIHIDAIAALEISGGKQMVHQGFYINPVGARCNHQAGGILVIRLIAKIFHHRQFLVAHLGGNLLEHLGTGSLEWQCSHNNIAIFPTPHRAHFYRAATGLIGILYIRLTGNNLTLGGEVRGFDKLHQLRHGRLGAVQQVQAGIDHFPQVVGRNIGGHTHGDTGGAIEQYIGHPSRQNFRLLHGGIEVGLPINSALTQLRE